MSTHATPETRHASTTETTTEPDIEPGATEDEPAPIEPFGTHDTAATFGNGTDRLPNTVDDENKYLG